FFGYNGPVHDSFPLLRIGSSAIWVGNREVVMTRFCRVCMVVSMILMSEICVCEAATDAGPIGSLTGRVRALGDVAAPDAEVQIVDLHMRIAVERDGAFHANGLPAGEHRVMA